MDRKRILFYSHDTFGLGHIRRVLAIGHTIVRERGAAVLIVSGSGFLHQLEIPPEIDTIKLPTVIKVGDDCYRSRFLPLPLEDIIHMRSKILLEAARWFEPDIFAVDNVPLGLKGEAGPALEWLRRNRSGCRTVLTLRDILDHPEKITRRWRRDGIYRALERHYDAVLVFGLQDIYDVTQEYRIPDDTAAKFRFCGYIDKASALPTPEEARARMGLNGHRLVLVTAGGGGDGEPLVETALRTLAARGGEPLRGLIVLGPDFPFERERRLRGRYTRHRHLVITRFTNRLPDFMQASDLVISMGGYNTVCEILSLRKRAIVVPRSRPREEQLMRARLLSARGVLDYIHPERLDADLLSSKIDEQLRPGTPRPEGIDLGGLRRSAEVFREMLAG